MNILRNFVPLLAAILLSGCASDHTVLVALDRQGYRLRELTFLEADVQEAAAFRSDKTSIDTRNGAVTVTIWNATKDGAAIDVIRKVASDHEASIEVTPAKAFWVRLSPGGAATPSAQRFEQRYEGYIESLRPMLPGVTVKQDGDAAIVEASDPGFGDTLVKALNHTFLATQLTTTSWRVSWNMQLLSQTFSAEKQKEMLSKTAEAVRVSLGDPLQLQVYEGGDPDTDDVNGAHFLVRDPARHTAFIESVRKAFDQNPLFVFSEIDALDARFVGSKIHRRSRDVSEFDVIEALDPPNRIRIEGDGILVEAEDPARNGQLASIVREDLAGINGFVFKPLSNGALRVELAQNARLGPALPNLPATDFAKSVTARIDGAGVRPKQITPLDSEHVGIVVATQADADTIRVSLSEISGLTLRLVDEPRKGMENAPPSPGDTKLTLPNGEGIWVEPRAIVTGDMIADAAVSQDRYTGQPQVAFRLTDEGRSRFAAATRRYMGRRLAMIVDGTALQAPIIMTPIMGGAGLITGHFTTESASALVKQILPHRDDLLLTVK